jgi:hypothetical protein
VDAIGNTVRDGTGFPRACPGQDTQRPVQRTGDFPLFGVQATEDPFFKGFWAVYILCCHFCCFVVSTCH